MFSPRPETIVKPLRPGDEVLAIAVSSAVEDTEKFNNGLKIFESWGLKCNHTNLIKRRWGYLAGNDESRHQDLHSKTSPELLVFARGGWGAARLLERPQPWRNGWLLGYSDITALHLARLKAGFDGCVHGPFVSCLPEEPLWSKERLKNLLFGKHIPDLQGDGIIQGIAIGPLFVANLTVASHILGSAYMPDLKGSILIFEDIGEEPYRIDRMLTQWRLAGLLQGLAGIGFGKFKGCNAPKDIPLKETFQLEQVLIDRTKDLGIPVIANLPIGHNRGNAALPLGRTSTLNGSKGLLSIVS